MNKNNDIRVGYGTLNTLLDLTNDYIEIHTVDHKYKGDPQYLIQQWELYSIIYNNEEHISNYKNNV